MSFLLFVFIFFLFVILFVLTMLKSLLSVIFSGFRKSTGRGRQNSTYGGSKAGKNRTRYGWSGTEDRTKSDSKVFQKDEGEYIKFEEIE